MSSVSISEILVILYGIYKGTKEKQSFMIFAALVIKMIFAALVIKNKCNAASDCCNRVKYL